MSGPQRLNVPLFDRKRYPAVGLCIYCGASDDLTDEHIMPFGLGGNLILPKASCGSCAKITSGIERRVLRGPLRPIRVARGIQSRRKHRDAPTKLPLRVLRGGDWETIYLPYDEYPLLLNFVVFDVPGYLDSAYRGGIRICGHLTYRFGPTPNEVMARLGVRELEISQEQMPSEFAKMTAKVAYSMAVAERIIDPACGRPEIVRSILGHSDDIGMWVGTVAQPRQWIENVLHFIGIERDREQGILIGRVQYLTDTGTPVYLVILARLDDPFVNSAT